jgi:hypothetical protein
MRKSIIRQVLTVTLLLGAAPPYLVGQACPDATKMTAGLEGPIATVRYLADDALEGRLAGSSGERCAGDYLADRFRQLGLRPAGEAGTYFQSFSVASAANPHAPSGTGRNVLALLEGADPQLKTEYIIIGAHYDHLGMGLFGSTAASKQPAIHNGADDNASGVAALLEVAARLAKGPPPARSVLFMAFTGEESGLLGSSHWVNHPTQALTQARGMINMDMVGRLGQGPLIVYGVGTATEWKRLVTQATDAQKIEAKLIDDGYGASDHTSFYLKDIPVLHFFTNVHADYHKPSDDWEKIDGPGLLKVSAIISDVASSIANKQTTLTLVKGVGKPPAAAGASRGSAAFLGTVPDFTPVPKGVKLSGVGDGSPAQKAGLKAGDIIIRFDDTEIADLQAMSDALHERKPDDVVKITVLREGKEVVLTATLGKR